VQAPQDVLTSLPRRKPIGGGGEFRPSRMPRLEIPRPTQLGVARAMLGWAARGLWLLLWILLDTLRGVRGEERTAQHVYHILAGMDPVARKVAQLFTYRFDLLSIPTATTLARLDDLIAPLATEVAVMVVERALEAPLNSVFTAFDPKPLGSRVLRCTYQGVLHDGTAVIVRIRPPGMRQRLLDQLTALERLLAVLEVFTVVRPGFFRYLKTENATLLMEEADFRRQARSQRLFDKRIRRDKLGFAVVAPLYQEWVRDNLTIEPTVHGLWLSEVMAIVEEADPEKLARLRAQDIEPERLARRLMQLAWWEQIENLFFQAAPIPADVVAEPGGRLAVVHFPTIAATTSRHRSLLRDLYARVAAEDASGATEVLIQFLTPMPFIDTHAFFKRVEMRVWHQILAMRDNQALWWERTSVGLWAALLSAARSEGIQVHLEVIELMRSSMMFEAMAFRLNPEFDLVKEFRRYRRKSDERAARRLGRSVRRALGGDARSVMVARLSEAATLAQRVGFFVETRLENLPITNLAMPRKAAYAASVMLQTVTLGLLAAVLGIGLRVAGSVARGKPVDFSLAASQVVHHPAYIALVTVLGLIAVRRLLFRLGDKDSADGH
jgi:ubiquinone biosynthesis protein